MFAKLKFDLPSSVVVFLVALPLCLGVALASGAPMLSGVIAGVIGGYGLKIVILLWLNGGCIRLAVEFEICLNLQE